MHPDFRAAKTRRPTPPNVLWAVALREGNAGTIVFVKANSPAAAWQAALDAQGDWEFVAARPVPTT